MSFLKRLITLPRSMNSLRDAARNPIGAIAGLANLASYATGIPGLQLPGWVSTVARVGGVLSQLQAMQEAQRMSSGIMADMSANRQGLFNIITALQSVPRPTPIAPRLEQMMRANMQTALEQVRRQYAPGVDVSGMMNLMQARALGQIAEAYNQQAMRDEELARQDYLQRLQMAAGMYGNLFGQQQAMYGLAMQRQQLVQQGIANSLLVLNDMMRRSQAGAKFAGMTAKPAMMGASAAMTAMGIPGGATLWELSRRMK